MNVPSLYVSIHISTFVGETKPEIDMSASSSTHTVTVSAEQSFVHLSLTPAQFRKLAVVCNAAADGMEPAVAVAE